MVFIPGKKQNKFHKFIFKIYFDLTLRHCFLLEGATFFAIPELFNKYAITLYLYWAAVKCPLILAITHVWPLAIWKISIFIIMHEYQFSYIISSLFQTKCSKYWNISWPLDGVLLFFGTHQSNNQSKKNLNKKCPSPTFASMHMHYGWLCI